MRLTASFLPGPAMALLLLGAAQPALAHPGGWGGSWGGDRWDRTPDGPAAGHDRTGGPPEGRVSVSTFVTDDQPAAALLKQGTIAVGPSPGGSGLPGDELAVYAAAVVDQLAQLGYRTDVPESTAGQVTELHVSHETLSPPEVKKPVSGEMAVGVSNRGTAYGLGLNIDLTKPRSALISTTLEARIRDRASGKVLWEGRADISTRDGDDKWPARMIAARLAAALFDRFPGTSGPG
ncbi:MAG TPA: DUF4136 domain-containing protein [Novosphingobium sp.]